MNSKQLEAVLPLEFPLLINKLPLLFLTQQPTVLGKNLIVLPHGLGRDTLINQLLNFLVDEEGICGLLFLT